eukprot:15169201-Alexandrium_andersonii.AAC.1
MRDLTRDFAEAIDPVNGPGSPAVQAAARGASWLGPDPRASKALSRPGMKTKVPIDWVGPEETEMFEQIPISERLLDYQPAGTNPRELPNGLDHLIY